MCSSPGHHKGVAGLTVIAVCATVGKGVGVGGQLAAPAASSVATSTSTYPLCSDPREKVALEALRDEFSIDPLIVMFILE